MRPQKTDKGEWYLVPTKAEIARLVRTAQVFAGIQPGRVAPGESLLPHITAVTSLGMLLGLLRPKWQEEVELSQTDRTVLERAMVPLRDMVELIPAAGYSKDAGTVLTYIDSLLSSAPPVEEKTTTA